MRKIKVIVFDLGNVLIPFDFKRVINALNNIEEDFGENFALIYEQNKNYFREFEKGNIAANEFISQNLSWLNHKIEREKFCELFSDMFELNENVISLLPILEKNYRLILLSNTNDIHRKYGWDKYDFLKYFEKLILSYEAGALKPEEKIYNAVTNYTKENPEAHLFIDDILEYVEAAINLGWDGIHFQNYNQLIEEMKKKSILIDG